MKSRLGERVNVTPDPILDAAQRETFRREGYLVLEDFVSQAGLRTITQLVKGLLLHPAPVTDGMRFDYLAVDGATPEATSGGAPLMQQLLPFDYEPRLFETELFVRGAHVGYDLLGEALLYRGSHYMEKPAGVGPATPWHQDDAFWEPKHHHEAIAIWLPLEGATAESGCMRFVGGSHTEDALLPHRHIGGDRRVHGLEIADAWIDERSVETCPLRPGGVTVHHCRIVHGSGPNVSNAPRRALVLNFEAPPTLLATPRDVPWQNTTAETARLRDEKGIELP